MMEPYGALPRKCIFIYLFISEEVSSINSGLSDFLNGLSLAKPTFVCLNIGERMRGTQPICGQLWIQEDRQMTAMGKCLPDIGTTLEEVVISGIADALACRYTLEIVDYEAHPEYKRPGQRVIVYPKFLDRLGGVLATGDPSVDPVDSRRPAYEAILIQSCTWEDSRRPIMSPEESEALTRWPELARNFQEWMEDAKRIAVPGYRQVLEDGPEFCFSESEAEDSDHGEVWTDADMYMPEMPGPDGKAFKSRSRLTTGQANRLRAAGREGGQTTVPEKG
jgi:hypothetical protein